MLYPLARWQEPISPLEGLHGLAHGIARAKPMPHNHRHLLKGSYNRTIPLNPLIAHHRLMLVSLNDRRIRPQRVLLVLIPTENLSGELINHPMQPNQPLPLAHPHKPIPISRRRRDLAHLRGPQQSPVLPQLAQILNVPATPIQHQYQRLYVPPRLKAPIRSRQWHVPGQYPL